MKIIKGMAVLLALVFTGAVQAQTAKPNFLFIWGDDIGPFNISACTPSAPVGQFSLIA